jgi:enoyl-CoA hydratase/carnithine racemase
MSKEMLLDYYDEIAVITINRPEHNNAFSETMLRQWLELLHNVNDNDSVKGLILTGKGKVFCSGGSIKDMVDGKMSGWDMKNFLSNYVHKIAIFMDSFQKPAVAAINGAAIGAGLDMALMCDFRICSDKAVLGEAYIKLGLVAGDGGAYLLPRVIGIPRALEMLLTGKNLTPSEAYNWGLVNSVVKHEDLIDESIKFLKNITKWSFNAVKTMKQLVYSSGKQTLEEHLREVSSHMGMLSNNKEFKEFTGRLLKNLLDKN